MNLNLTGNNNAVEATDALYREGNDEDQMTKGSLSMAWYGVASAMFFVYIGAALAMAYGTKDALIGLALTIVAYGLINRILAKYAINNRTTVALFSRTILGTAGSAIATIIFALVAIYYAVFEGSIVAYAFQVAFGGEMWMWSLIVVIYSTPLIIGGVCDPSNEALPRGRWVSARAQRMAAASAPRPRTGEGRGSAAEARVVDSG